MLITNLPLPESKTGMGIWLLPKLRNAHHGVNRKIKTLQAT